MWHHWTDCNFVYCSIVCCLHSNGQTWGSLSPWIRTSTIFIIPPLATSQTLCPRGTSAARPHSLLFPMQVWLKIVFFLDWNMLFCKDGCDFLITCSLSDKLLSARVYPDPQIQRSSIDPPGSSGLMFPLPGCNISRPDASKPWMGGAGSSAPRAFGGAGGEVDEETKKNQNIINIVREGQISLLVSAENTDQL